MKCLPRMREKTACTKKQYSFSHPACLCDMLCSPKTLHLCSLFYPICLYSRTCSHFPRRCRFSSQCTLYATPLFWVKESLGMFRSTTPVNPLWLYFHRDCIAFRILQLTTQSFKKLESHLSQKINARSKSPLHCDLWTRCKNSAVFNGWRKSNLNAGGPCNFSLIWGLELWTAHRCLYNYSEANRSRRH